MLPSDGGGGSLGRALGSSVAKAVKPKSTGRSVGRAVAKTNKSSRSSGSSRSTGRSVGRSAGRAAGGNSNRGGGGGGGGGGSRPPVSSPAIPSINAYLGTDSVYQSALRGGKRSLADFLSELGRRRGEAGTQFTQTKSNMERDRTTQLEALRDEFAARGLIQSGLYGEEQGRFQEQFMQQMQALEQQQSGLLADLLGQETNFRRENDLAMEAAKQEALARRAAKFKIGA